MGKLLRDTAWGQSPYKESLAIRIYPSGERRVTKDPPADLILKAFDELGTHVAVSGAFGVDRRVVARWIATYKLDVVSRPELRLANATVSKLNESKQALAVAQWLMDEGSVSVAYLRSSDLTALLVCGSMCDFAVLSRVSAALGANIVSSRLPTQTSLPMCAVRVQSAKAHALLRALKEHLYGLKAMEADEALRFFPSSGVVRGRHTTDEFLEPVWRKFANETLVQWNSRRRIKEPPEVLEGFARTWVRGRIRRARRFIDAAAR